MQLYRLLLALLLLPGTTTMAFSQAARTFMLDAKGNETENSKKAKLLIQEKKISNTCWQYDTYPLWGPMIKSEQFKAREGKILHGRSIYYTAAGRIDSLVSYADGLAQGTTLIYNDTGRIAIRREYEQGKLVSTIDVIREAEEKGLIMLDSSASFPGGGGGWIQFLNKNLHFPDRAIGNKIQGDVRVQFIVDTEGKVSEIELNRSVEYSLDEEALRIIRKSPRWSPASLNGQLLKTFQVQPLHFRLQ